MKSSLMQREVTAVLIPASAVARRQFVVGHAIVRNSTVVIIER